VRVVLGFEGEGRAEVTEQELLVFVRAHDTKQLRVDGNLVLLALLAYGVGLFLGVKDFALVCLGFLRTLRRK